MSPAAQSALTVLYVLMAVVFLAVVVLLLVDSVYPIRSLDDQPQGDDQS